MIRGFESLYSNSSAGYVQDFFYIKKILKKFFLEGGISYILNVSCKKIYFFGGSHSLVEKQRTFNPLIEVRFLVAPPFFYSQ